MRFDPRTASSIRPNESKEVKITDAIIIDKVRIKLSIVDGYS